MAIEASQTCDVCKQKRELRPLRLPADRTLGGWREIDGHDICPNCIKKVFE